MTVTRDRWWWWWYESCTQNILKEKYVRKLIIRNDRNTHHRHRLYKGRGYWLCIGGIRGGPRCGLKYKLDLAVWIGLSGKVKKNAFQSREAACAKTNVVASLQRQLPTIHPFPVCLYPLRLNLGWPWNCSDQQNVVEVMFWVFWAQGLRGPAVFTSFPWVHSWDIP